jgi:hypothetical protein
MSNAINSIVWSEIDFSFVLPCDAKGSETQTWVELPEEATQDACQMEKWKISSAPDVGSDFGVGKNSFWASIDWRSRRSPAKTRLPGLMRKLCADDDSILPNFVPAIWENGKKTRKLFPIHKNFCASEQQANKRQSGELSVNYEKWRNNRLPERDLVNIMKWLAQQAAPLPTLSWMGVWAKVNKISQ